MSVEETIEDLTNHIAFLKEKIQQIAADIITVLEEDLPKFVEREVKRHFLASGEFAQKMSNDNLKKLKEAIASYSSEATQKVIASIRDPEIWLQGRTAAKQGTLLEHNSNLWERINQITVTVKRILDEFGFPPVTDSESLEYKPPKWFIAHLYLPSLAEAYWKRINELVEMEGQVDEIESETTRMQLKDRWDSV